MSTLKTFFQKDKVKAVIFTAVLDILVVVVAQFVPEVGQGTVYALLAAISTAGISWMKFHTDTDKASIELKIAEIYNASTKKK